MFDCLIVGGGVAGMQCALILGSAKDKVYAKDKKIGFLHHQRNSHLKKALLNNVLGVSSGTLGKDILTEGLEQLTNLYPQVEQLGDENIISVLEEGEVFCVSTVHSEYKTKNLVLALNYAKPFKIEGLAQYIEPHSRSMAKKDRIQLRNFNHLIKKGLFVCGTIAGHTSQFAIAAGSGATVGTDILSIWSGQPTKIHDKI